MQGTIPGIHMAQVAMAMIRFMLVNAGTIARIVTGIRRIESDFVNRRDHEEARPPRTLAALIEQNKSATQSSDKALVVAMSLEQLTRNQNSPQRFHAMDKDERQAAANRRQDMQKFRNERQKLEAETAVTRANNPTDPDRTGECQTFEVSDCLNNCRDTAKRCGGTESPGHSEGRSER